VRCKGCGAAVDFTMASCPACGAEVELGRLTGILGVVCRGCDAYNDPGARACAACGKPLAGAEPTPAAPFSRLSPQSTVAAPVSPEPTPPWLAPPPATPPAPVRSFATGSGAGGGATRFVPAAALRTPGPPPPLAPGRVRLVLEGAPALAPAAFPLDADAVEAGRSRGALRFPDDPALASHHATFLFRAGVLLVRDEGAPGGTFVRLRGQSTPLRPGDHFVAGDRLLRFAGPLPPAPQPAPDGTRRLGAPRPLGVAIVLEERLEGGASGRVFVRGGPSVTIGRAGCAVNLGDDAFLSQAHAEIVVDAGGGARLRDLGSSRGTYVRIAPHGERELRDGDTVRLGRQVLRVAVAV
jgi:hypothetical protein